MSRQTKRARRTAVALDADTLITGSQLQQRAWHFYCHILNNRWEEVMTSLKAHPTLANMASTTNTAASSKLEQRNLLATSPNQASSFFSSSLSFQSPTFLHMACTEPNVPPSVITLLLHRNPYAAEQLDSQQRTPLHIATSNGCHPMIIQELVKIYPNAVNCVDAWGSSPLHYACSHEHCNTTTTTSTIVNNNTNNHNNFYNDQNGTVATVRVLLDTIQSNNSFKCCYRRKNRHGRTPLHLSCLWHVPSEVTKMILLSANCSSDNNNTTTNPSGCHLQGEEGEEHLVYIRDNYGENALDFISGQTLSFCNGSSGLNENVRHAVTVVDESSSPTHSFPPPPSLSSSIASSSSAAANITTSYFDIYKNGINMWEKASMLVKAQLFIHHTASSSSSYNNIITENYLSSNHVDNNSNSYNNDTTIATLNTMTLQQQQQQQQRPWRIVHACASLPGCPIRMLEIAIQLNSHQIYEFDEITGNLPLHSAASLQQQPTSNNTCRKSGGSGIYQHACTGGGGGGRKVLELLLSAYPKAIQTRNRQGKLPLQLALEGGMYRWNTGIKLLYNAYPKAIAQLTFKYNDATTTSINCSGNDNNTKKQKESKGRRCCSNDYYYPIILSQLSSGTHRGSIYAGFLGGGFGTHAYGECPVSVLYEIIREVPELMKVSF